MDTNFQRRILEDVKATVPNANTRRNHEGRLRRYFSTYKVEGKDLNEQMANWVEWAKVNVEPAENQSLDFVDREKLRLNTGEIGSANTIEKSLQALEKVCGCRVTQSLSMFVCGIIVHPFRLSSCPC
ncbi:MAG: hypothetical protein JRN03_06140 [Nitrososphaerota archaeon]|nr:hypothetical protein [Nitrososphaerota archaeon]